MSNPLLDFTDLPLFDRIRPEHVAPAIDTLLAECEQALDTVVAPDFPAQWQPLARTLDCATERLGRAWVAVREDELAASSLGVNTARVKLAAFAVGAALVGLAGCLYATRLTTTAGPDAYDFSRSVIVLACVLLGGLGSIRGVLLGVFLLLGFDNVLAPILDGLTQRVFGASNNPLLTFSNWRLCIFGLALILVMRFRPEGLWPARRAERSNGTRMNMDAADERGSEEEVAFVSGKPTSSVIPCPVHSSGGN